MPGSASWPGTDPWIIITVTAEEFHRCYFTTVYMLLSYTGLRIIAKLKLSRIV